VNAADPERLRCLSAQPAHGRECALGAGPNRLVACSRTRASPDTRTLPATQIGQPRWPGRLTLPCRES